MSTKEPKAVGPTDPWAEFSRQWLSAYKANLDTLLAVASATLAGAERMRMAQLAADVETQAQNRQAAKDLAASQDVPGVLAAQSQLSGAYSDGYLRCWTAMAEAAQSTQLEIAQILSARAGEINEEMRKTIAGGARGVPPLPDSLTQLMEAARGQQEAMLAAVSSLASLHPDSSGKGPGHAGKRAH
jgi:Phasin protein